MTRRLATLLLASALASAPACGRKGPLELPPGRAPQPVEGLSAVLKDGAVVLAWTNPARTVSGHDLGPLGEAEVWVFERDAPAAGAVPSPAAVEGKARLAGRLSVAAAAASTFVFEPAPSSPARPAFTVRVRDRRGRASAFAPVAVVPERERP